MALTHRLGTGTHQISCIGKVKFELEAIPRDVAVVAERGRHLAEFIIIDRSGQPLRYMGVMLKFPARERAIVFAASSDHVVALPGDDDCPGLDDEADSATAWVLGCGAHLGDQFVRAHLARAR